MSEVPAHELTQGALVELLARTRPGREALVYPERGLRWTFADLDRRSLELARGLVALGVETGDRVAVWADNRPDWIPLQFALARIGAILVTANTALTRHEIEYLLRQSRCSVVVAAPGVRDREYVDALEELRAEPERLPELHAAVVIDGEAPDGFLSVDELVERGASVDEAVVHDRCGATGIDDAANIQYTSGTTGFPKGVVLTHRNIVENAYTMARMLGTRDDDRLLLQVPLFHCFGCVISVLGAYTHGIPLVALDRFDPAAALRAMAAERCTIVHGVPTMFLAMLSEAGFGDHDLGALRTGIMAGTMCPEPLMRRVIDEMGCRGMLVAYGLTEASPAVTSSAPGDSVPTRCGTVGRAIPGVEVRIVDPGTGEDLPDGTAGELWTRGPNVMQGYFEMPEATAEAVTPDGWLRTGDLATKDADGLIRIAGRLKEMIIRGGENVYPAEVEDALREHPAVRDAAVFGVPSEQWGEEVAAAVVLGDGESVTEEELVGSLEDRLAHFKRPSLVAFVERFPLTGSGKVQKFRLPEFCGFR